MSSRIKIERAKKHLSELQEVINQFFATTPYNIATKRNPKEKKLVYYLTDVANVPEEIAAISGDIIQNLRSALDHIAYDLFIQENKGSLKGKHIYFPIEKGVEVYEQEKERKTKGISEANLKIIDSTKPYKGGNDVLWRISELNNIDKHRLLITVGSSFGSMDIGAHVMNVMKKLMQNKDLPDVSLFIKPADNLFPLRKGDALFIDGPDAEIIPNMQFRFEVVLNEKDIIEGAPLIETLQNMIEEVEKVHALFK